MQRVADLKAELAKKEAEVSATTAKLAEASKSLAEKVETISSLRKASNDLRAKIVANNAKKEVLQLTPIPCMRSVRARLLQLGWRRCRRRTPRLRRL